MNEKKIATIAAMSNASNGAGGLSTSVIVLRSGLLIAVMAGILVLMDARAGIVTADREIARPAPAGELAVGIEPRPTKKQPPPVTSKTKIPTAKKTTPLVVNKRPKRVARLRPQRPAVSPRAGFTKPTALVPDRQPTKLSRATIPAKKSQPATKPRKRSTALVPATPRSTPEKTTAPTKPSAPVKPAARVNGWAAREITEPIAGAYVIIYLRQRVLQIRVGRTRVRRYANLSLPENLGSIPRVKGWYYYLQSASGKGANTRLEIAYLSPAQAAALKQAGAMSAASVHVVNRANAAAGASPLATKIHLSATRPNDTEGITLHAEELQEIARALHPGAWVIIKP